MQARFRCGNQGVLALREEKRRRRALEKRDAAVVRRVLAGVP
jgi:hypothetical protein